MKIRRVKAKYISYTMLALLVGFVILLALSPITGLRFDAILSGACPVRLMSGTCVVTPQSPDHLKVGDVIVFRSTFSDEQICHRIISITQRMRSWFSKLKGTTTKIPIPSLYNQIASLARCRSASPSWGM